MWSTYSFHLVVYYENKQKFGNKRKNIFYEFYSFLFKEKQIKIKAIFIMHASQNGEQTFFFSWRMVLKRDHKNNNIAVNA